MNRDRRDYRQVVHDFWVEDKGCEECFGTGVNILESRWETATLVVCTKAGCTAETRLRTGIDPAPRVAKLILRAFETAMARIRQLAAERDEARRGNTRESVEVHNLRYRIMHLQGELKQAKEQKASINPGKDRKPKQPRRR